jgi:putative CocE/NonD family hydrolase
MTIKPILLTLVLMTFPAAHPGFAQATDRSGAPNGEGGRQRPSRLDLPASAAKDEAVLDQAMPAVAKGLMAGYKENDREVHLDNLFRLQMVAGQYAEAIRSIQSLRVLQKSLALTKVDAQTLPYEIFCNAKLKQASGGLSFTQAFQQSFREAFAIMNDWAAYRAAASFTFALPSAQSELKAMLDQRSDKTTLAAVEALALVRTYQPYVCFREMLPLAKALVAEDDARRYIIQNDVLIKTEEGATISAVIYRQKSVHAPQPTALSFTIYADQGNYSQARLGAAHGYVGMIAYSRGKALSPDAIAPYEHEVQDVPAVIDWISRQSWSDGRVGMFGGSYNGFTQWAATKHLHPALKTIVPYVAAIPGLGLPMENNVFLNANYGWAFYVTDNKYLDDKVYSDRERWRSLNRTWFASGKPYREIDQVDGTPNPWLQRWLQHPSYDAYWQAMVPFQEDFARINIPVLTITGYYDDGQISALEYLNNHYTYNPNANHYLIIGPYDHFGSQRSRKEPVLREYAIDPVAQIDTPEITFEWLDYVLRGGKKPALLEDKINYQVMGANEWKHAPSLAKMSNETLTLYLTDEKEGDHYRLAKDKPAKPRSLSQVVDLADRKNQTNTDYYPFPIVGGKPDFSTGYAFISAPFEEAVEVDGTFSGEIKAIINKKDMDIGVVLYEVMPGGELFNLSYFLGRASYAQDMSLRHLLTPGNVEAIPFRRTRLVSRKLSKGSRLLVLLDVNKNAFAEVNHGTGKDVGTESSLDAKTPLEIQWRSDSYVSIPIYRSPLR